MYNEELEDLERSLRGVLRKSTRGKNVMIEKSLVIVIVDGVRELMRPEKRGLVSALEAWELYDRHAVERTLKLWREKPELKPKDCCFVFQSKIDVQELQPEPNYRCKPWMPAYSSSLSIPIIHSNGGLDILLVVKPDNRRKLHSHLWLMYALARSICPSILIVLPT